MVKVKAKVVSLEGYCSANQKKGDEIIFDWDNHKINGKICLHSLYSIMPKIYALAHGANVAFYTNEDGKKVARHACPDGYNPVIYELSIVK